MKKQLLIVGLWVCSGMLCQPVQAQSVDKANEEYKTFVRPVSYTHLTLPTNSLV